MACDELNHPHASNGAAAATRQEFTPAWATRRPADILFVCRLLVALKSYCPRLTNLVEQAVERHAHLLVRLVAATGNRSTQGVHAVLTDIRNLAHAIGQLSGR